MALRDGFVDDATLAPGGAVTFLSLATLSQAGASFTQQGVAVLGVFFASTYHLSLAQMGFLVSSISLGWALSGIFMGMLVDRFGSRRVLLAGPVVMSVVAALISLVSSVQALVALLFVLGISISLVPAAGSKAVLLAWDAHGRGLPMGIRQTGVPLGAMTAAFLLPRLAPVFGLHAIFIGFAVVLLGVGWAFAASIVPAEAAPAPRPMPATAPRAAASHPYPTRAELRRILPIGACAFLLAWGQYDLLTYSIPMLHTADGLTIAAAGTVLALSQVGGGTGRIVFGALSDRLGGRRDIVLASVAAACTIFALSLAVLPAHVPALALAALWLVLGVGFVGWNALAMTWAGERVPVRHAGVAMGLVGSCAIGGGVVGPPVFGLVVDATGNYASGWLVLTVAALAAALIAGSLVRRARHSVASSVYTSIR